MAMNQKSLVKHLSSEATMMLEKAVQQAVERGHDQVGVALMLQQMIRSTNKEINTVIRLLGIDKNALRMDVDQYVRDRDDTTTKRPVFSPVFFDWLEDAYSTRKKKYDESTVRSESLFIQLLLEKERYIDLKSLGKLNFSHSFLESLECKLHNRQNHPTVNIHKLAKKLSHESYEVFSNSIQSVEAPGLSYVLPEHFLMAIINADNKLISSSLLSSGVKKVALLDRLGDMLQNTKFPSYDDSILSPALSRWIQDSWLTASIEFSFEEIGLCVLFLQAVKYQNLYFHEFIPALFWINALKLEEQIRIGLPEGDQIVQDKPEISRQKTTSKSNIPEEFYGVPEVDTKIRSIAEKAAISIRSSTKTEDINFVFTKLYNDWQEIEQGLGDSIRYDFTQALDVISHFVLHLAEETPYIHPPYNIFGEFLYRVRDYEKISSRTLAQGVSSRMSISPKDALDIYTSIAEALFLLLSRDTSFAISGFGTFVLKKGMGISYSKYGEIYMLKGDTFEPHYASGSAASGPLSKELASLLGIKRHKSKGMIRTAFQVFLDYLKMEKTLVEWNDIGEFFVYHRPPTTGKNPQTGTPVSLPEVSQAVLISTPHRS